jgi:hypothetical protein
MSHAAHVADNFPKPWRLKRFLPAPKRFLGGAGAALLKALDFPSHAATLIKNVLLVSLKFFRRTCSHFEHSIL